jgi:hypothetical protein
MKWSYTSGKINVSSGEEDQQFLLNELIEEASRHRSKKKIIFFLFIVLSLILVAMMVYGYYLDDEAKDPGEGWHRFFFYSSLISTPIVISLFISSIIYAVIRRSPKNLKKLNQHFKD